MVGFAFGLFRGSDLKVEGYPEVPRIVSPLPSIGWAGTLTFVALLVLVVALIATVVAVRGRFKSSTGIERLQLSWLAYASALIPLSIIICLAESAITGDAGVGVEIAIGVTTVAIPLSIAVAVLRYRLYEIERLVNRTLVYVALTGALAIAYGGWRWSWAWLSAAAPWRHGCRDAGGGDGLPARARRHTARGRSPLRAPAL